jgi:hypothetical protein
VSEELAGRAARLREELNEAFDGGALERFLREQDALASPRARLGLPWSATPDVLAHGAEARLRWTPPRPVEFKVESGVVEFSCLRRRWRFAEAALAVIGPLAERRVCTLPELCEGAAARLHERTTRALVRELIVHGLVAIVRD